MRSIDELINAEPDDRVKQLEAKVAELEQSHKQQQIQILSMQKQIEYLMAQFRKDDSYFAIQEESQDRSLSYQTQKQKSSTDTLSRKESLLMLSQKMSKGSSLSGSKSFVKQESGKSSSSYTPKLQYQHSNVIDTREWERAESEDSDEATEQTDSKQIQIDIAFLHSEVLVYETDKQEIKSMNIDQELSARVMYQQLIEKLQAKKKKFNVYSRGLTSPTLQDVFVMQPAVLFLNCHGGFYHDKTTSQNITYLCFQNESQPTLMRKFSVANLKNLIIENQVQLVVISACHSSQFANALVEAGVPAVVSISASDKVLEKAAEAFNQVFLDYILKGLSPKQAYDLSLAVLSSDSSNFEICCCQHDHSADCLWVQYKEKYGDYEAHRLHAYNCCNRKDFGPLDHFGNCVHYRDFYNKLVGGNLRNVELVLDNSNKGFLQMPSNQMGVINKMCCCASFLSHNESQKFMIMGSKQGLESPIFDLSRRPDGDVHEDLPIDYKNMPQWLRKESNWLYDRNIEINEMVTFFIGTKRLLTVVGEQSSGRTAIVVKAIKMVMASSNSTKFRDGVFEVDLENIGMPSIIKKISDTLGLNNPFPKVEALIRDLIKKDMLIVFTDCRMTSQKETQQEILRLIQRIILQTGQDERLKFVVMMNVKHNSEKFDQEHVIKIGPMSRKGKVRLFIHYLKNENKGHLFTEREQEIRDHPIFDVVGPFNINKIASNYKSIESLNQMQQEIQLSLKRNRSSNTSDSSFKKEKASDNNLRLRSLFCSDLLKLIPQECCQERNLIFFLCLLPAGITQTEITQLTKIYKKWFGRKFSIIDRMQNESNVNQSVLIEQEETYLDLLEFNKIQDLDDQCVVKINRDYLSGLELVLDHADLELRSEQEQQKQKKKDLLSICIEFMGSQARSILRSLKRKERSGTADYRLVTAHLDCGMWWRYPNEEESFDEEIAQAEQRFSHFYLTNFRYLLDEKMLLMNFKDLWGDKLTQESEYIIDLCLTVPSILVQLSRYQEAEDLIKHCRQFGQGKTLLLHAYLDLMLASINVHNNALESSQHITQLLETARKTFLKFHWGQTDTQIEDLGHIEGRAETFFVEALLQIQVFKNIIQQPQHAFRSQSSMPLQQNSKIFGPNKRSKSVVKPEEHCIYSHTTDLTVIIKQIQSALKEAFKCFDSIDDGFDWTPDTEPDYFLSNKLFGKAKTIIAEADFYINFYKDIFQRDLDQSGFDKTDQLKKLERAQDILHKRAIRAPVIQKHRSYETGLQNQTKTSKNLQALTICLQAQLQLLDVSDKNIDDIICARTIIDKAICLLEDVDDNMAQTIRNVKNIVLDQMRSYSHNLFTFAKAWPLVEKEKSGQIKSIGEFPTSRFELAPKIEDAFRETKLDLQIKFDFLNSDLIKSVAESGSCVLHISSDIFDEDSLYLEDKIGVALRIPIDELSTYFQQFKIGNQFKKNRLPVDCVVLAMPDSLKIGQKFNAMGVEHVVAFNLTQGPHTEIESQLMPIRYNYIYTFCQQFYIALVKEFTVKEAFDQAFEVVNDQKTIDMDIWQMREFQERDLGIEPVMMDFNHDRHNKKLFDTKSHYLEREYIKEGPLYNVSKARGLLVGFKKAKDPYIGHKIELHHAMAALTNQVSVTRLCHIKGKRGVGKTRFLKEVAYYLYQRGMFSFKIQYQDLQDIKTEQAFKDMLQEKSLYNEQRSTVHPVETLLVFDNIDTLLPKLAKWFESRLMDLTQNNAGLRILTSATKTFTFEHFQKVDVGRRVKDDNKVNKMTVMYLKPLNDLQSVDLLLSLCSREITREELDMEHDNPNTVHKQLQLEQNVTALENRPHNIVELAKKLEKANFRDIRVIVHQDEKKHLPIHYTAKSKSSSVQFTVNNKNASASKESKDSKEHKQQSEQINLMQHMQNRLTYDQLNQSLHVLHSENGETSDYGRSRQSSLAFNGLLFDKHYNDEIIGRLEKLGTAPILEQKQSVMSNIEELTNSLQQKNYLKVPLSQQDHSDGQKSDCSNCSGRDRGLSNITDEVYAAPIAKFAKNNKQHNPSAKKGNKKKQRQIEKYKKQNQTKKTRVKVDCSDEDTPSKSVSSPSDVTEEDVTSKTKKVTKLTKQEKRELEWEHQKKNHHKS